MSVNLASAWHNVGFSTLARGKLSISDDKVMVSLDGKEEIAPMGIVGCARQSSNEFGFALAGTTIVIADGRSWRLDNVGLPYVLGIRPALGEA